MGQATILDDSVGDWELEKHLMRKATWNVELGRRSTAPEAADGFFNRTHRVIFKFWKPLNKDVHGKVLSGDELRESWDGGTMWFIYMQLVLCNWL